MENAVDRFEIIEGHHLPGRGIVRVTPGETGPLAAAAAGASYITVELTDTCLHPGVVETRRLARVWQGERDMGLGAHMYGLPEHETDLLLLAGHAARSFSEERRGAEKNRSA